METASTSDEKAQSTAHRVPYDAALVKPGSFEHLHSLLFQLPQQKYADKFEEICKWYLENSPKFDGLVSHVWLWSEWPCCWGADLGIDLVVESTSGEFWAVQSKAYAYGRPITKGEMDSFLSESSRAWEDGRKRFSQRLLIATTDKLASNARKVAEAQESPVAFTSYHNLARENIVWPKTLALTRRFKPKPKKPREDQREALRNIAKGLEANDRGQAIMACGTGKTLVELWASELVGSKIAAADPDRVKTLVLVPSITLISQTLGEWTANKSKHFDYLVVCSDSKVDRSRGDEDAFMEHVSELGVPVTTDPEVIRRFLGRDGRQVVFSTYQSSPRVAEALAMMNGGEENGKGKKRGRGNGGGVARGGSAKMAFDLLIADEAHNCAVVESSAFSTCLDDDLIPARKRLFCTATPRIYSAKKRQRQVEDGEWETLDVHSMDDEEKFGPVIHRLSFGEAIRRKLLSDYVVLIVDVSDEECKLLAEERRIVSIDPEDAGVVERKTGGEYDIKIVADGLALADAINKYDLRRVITFHNRVKRAKDFSRDFSEIVAQLPDGKRPSGELWTQHVAGTMPSDQRDRVLDRLRSLGDGERAVISNARCLGEGVDVPALDGIAFIDPRTSEIAIVQAVGRAIRKTDDDKKGVIVIPVLVDDGSSPEELLENSSFDVVWKVVRALKAHDEDLREQIDSANEEFGRTGKLRTMTGLSGARRGREVVEERDFPVVFANKGLGISIAKLSEVFQAKLVENCGESWDKSYGLLQKFLEENDGRYPRQKERYDGLLLGKWCSRQRQFHERGELSLKRESLLEGLPKWAWGVFDAKWGSRFENLLLFVEDNRRLPSDHSEDVEEREAGRWSSWQRQRYKLNKLTKPQVEALEGVVGWSWDMLEDAWMSHLQGVREFVQERKQLPYEKASDETEKDLGVWCATQRQRFTVGKVAEDRIKALETIQGWYWTYEDVWHSNYHALTSFARERGRVPSEEGSGEEKRLGKWCSRQRQYYKKGKLENDKVAMLEVIRGWYWSATLTRDAIWDENHEHVEAFIKSNKGLPSATSKDARERKLGIWLRNQRAIDRRGKLSLGRKEKLDEILAARHTREAIWDENHEQVAAFIKRNGRAPSTCAKDASERSLGMWLSNQRALDRRNELAAGRKERLSEIPAARHIREAIWDENHEQVVAFIKMSRRRPSAGAKDVRERKLGVWLCSQRLLDRQNKLAAGRKKRLDGILAMQYHSREVIWDENQEQVVDFIKGNGRRPSTCAKDARERKLGVWLNNQRALNRQGTLAAERKKKLDEILAVR